MRVAIVGGGISGISCMWGLKDTEWDVHLFESDSRLGGHANSVVFEGNGHSACVDTGFVVINETSYRECSLTLSNSVCQTYRNLGPSNANLNSLSQPDSLLS